LKQSHIIKKVEGAECKDLLGASAIRVLPSLERNVNLKEFLQKTTIF
jgi:hypothetical protein